MIAVFQENVLAKIKIVLNVMVLDVKTVLKILKLAVVKRKIVQFVMVRGVWIVKRILKNVHV